MTTTPGVPPAQTPPAPPTTQTPTPPAPAPRTWMPVTAGILSIIAGAIGFLIGIIIVSYFPIMRSMMYGGMGIGWLGAPIGVPFIILGIVAIVGGIYAIRRKVWGFALAGAICSLLWPILGIVTFGIGILGVLSIIFVSISKKEFA